MGTRVARGNRVVPQAPTWLSPKVYQGKNEKRRSTAPAATMTISPVVSLPRLVSATPAVNHLAGRLGRIQAGRLWR